MPRDHRDDVIEALADSEAALIEHVAKLQAQRDAFRTLAAICTQANIQLWRQVQMLDRRSDPWRLYGEMLREAVDHVVAEAPA